MTRKKPGVLARCCRGATSVMVIGFGILIILVLGLFCFEAYRAQIISSQLTAAADAAALAGTAAMIKSPAEDIADRQREGRNAAIAVFHKNFVLNHSLDDPNCTEVPENGHAADAPISKVGESAIAVIPVDPEKNFEEVQYGRKEGKALKIEARLVFDPATGKFLNLGTGVSASGQAIAGVPRLNIALVVDASGSMDDSTRVTMVRKRFSIPVDKLRAHSRYDEMQQQRAICEDPSKPYEARRDAFVAYKAIREQIRDDVGLVIYETVATGSINGIFRPWAYGTGVNARYPQQLELASRPAPELQWRCNFNSSLRDQNDPPAGYDDLDCFGAQPFRNSFTDLVTNIDTRRGPQPVFGPQQLSFVGRPVSFVDEQGRLHQFQNLGQLVEGFRGDYEGGNQPSSRAYRNNTNLFPIPAGTKVALQEHEKYYNQPMACTIDAASKFAKAFEKTEVKVSFITFETNVTDETSVFYPQYFNIADQYPRGGKSDFALAGVKLAQIDDWTKISKELWKNGRPLRSTDTAKALEFAKRTLEAEPADAFTERVIVLMTDGMPTIPFPGNELPENSPGAQASRQIARDCNRAGIPIFTIGVSQNAAIRKSQEKFLGDEYYPPAPEGLATLSGNGAAYIQVVGDDTESTNKIAEAFLQVASRLVRLLG